MEPEVVSHPPKPPKKLIEVLRVLVEKTTGHVKWYSTARRYGFISRADGEDDVFVHRSAITLSSKRYVSLRNGEEVEFSVVETNQGIEAASVTGLDGKPVKGARPLIRRRRPFRENNGHGESTDGQIDAHDTVEAAQLRGDRNVRRRQRGGPQRPMRPREDHSGDNAPYDAMGHYTTGEEHNGGQPHNIPPDGGVRARRRPFRGGRWHRPVVNNSMEGGGDSAGGVTIDGQHPDAPRGRPRGFRRPRRRANGFGPEEAQRTEHESYEENKDGENGAVQHGETEDFNGGEGDGARGLPYGRRRGGYMRGGRRGRLRGGMRYHRNGNADFHTQPSHNSYDESNANGIHESPDTAQHQQQTAEHSTDSTINGSPEAPVKAT